MKYILSVLCALSISINLRAQIAASKLTNVVSPEVATLGKFVDIPVGTYSGVPDISVPLYTAEYKAINIPLELRYHASGIKVDQEATWVGLGWDMFNGGFITQTIVGDLEEFVDHNFQSPAGFEQFKSRFLVGQYSGVSPINATSSWGCPPSMYDDPVYSEQEWHLIRHYLTRGWGQPDTYTFSFLGRSGKFVLDPITREPMVLNKSESFKIERLGTIPQSGWRIKTPDGMEFTFDLHSEGWSGRVVSQTWRLSKIKSFDGAVITFEYSIAAGAQMWSFSESLQSDFFEFQNGPYCPPSGAPTKASTSAGDRLLTKINTPKEVIEFVLEDRADPGYKRLKEIVIKDKISLLPKKAFEFQYGYFESDPSGNTWNPEANGKRLKLLSVREAGYNNQGIRSYNPSYKFAYNESIPFPQRTSYAVDYWGYYNGQRNNTTMLPDVVPLYVNTPILASIPQSLINTPYKANRGPSAAHMQVGMLEKITFPTGGYKQFTFEPHQFNNYVFYDASQVGELNVHASAVDQNYSNPSTPQSRHIGTLPVAVNIAFTFGVSRGPNGPGAVTFADVVSSYATLRKKYSDGTFSLPIKTWTMPDNIDVKTVFDSNGAWNISEDVNLTPEPGVEYWVTAYLPDAVGPQNQSGKNAAASITYKYYATTTSGTASYYGSGLRIAKVRLYDERDSLSYVTTYHYTKNGQPTGKLLSPPSFLQSGGKTYIKIMLNENPPIVGCPEFWVTTPKYLWTVTSGSNRSLQLSANSGYVGYSFVKVVERSTRNEANINSIVEYEFLNQNNPVGGGDFPEAPLLSNGLPTKVSYRKMDGTLIKKEVFDYFPAPDHSKLIHGYVAEEIVYGVDGCVSNNGCGGEWAVGHKYLLKSYPVRSQFWQLTSKSIKDYVAGDSLVTKQDYTYNSLGQIKSETTTNSRNDIVSKEYKYPIDYSSPTDPFPDSVVSNMNNKYFFPTIEEKQLLNATLQKQSVNGFTYNSPGKYVPKSLNVKNSSSTILDFINYTSYSSTTGNPKEFKGKNGVNTVVLWGRNGTVPIAKIEGATLAQVNGQVNSTTIETMANASLRTELLKLYNLTNCFVQVYLYDDKGQLIEIIDPSKTSTYFEYDAFGRFSLARDYQRNIIANYQYGYINSGAQ